MDGDVIGTLVSLIWLIPIVVFVVAAIYETRKMKQQREQEHIKNSARSAAHPEQKQQTPHSVQLFMAQAGEGSSEGQLRPEEPGMRPVTPKTLEGAGEGEDPCHVVERPADETESAYDPVVNRNPLAEQMLTGVIMSEVLKRPAERRMEQRMRRSM